MLSVGMLINNRYRIVNRLNQGGFGEVFTVCDRQDRHHSKVIKVLDPDKFCDSEKDKAIELFQREAQVLSELNHPGIPKVTADGYFTFVCGQKTLHCLVMPKIAGENLLDWLKNKANQANQPISSSLAIDWLTQILEICQYLHQHHYFHRDIKPANIMLQPNGKLVLIDFGAVRKISNTYLGKFAEEREHTVLMSLEDYTPIEQINGKAVPQSDFFAIARTMVHLLTGIAPHCWPENDCTGELIWRDRALQVPDALADLLDEMMALFPRERPASCQIILTRLKKLQFGNYSGFSKLYHWLFMLVMAKFGKFKPAIAIALSVMILTTIGGNFVTTQLAIKLNQRGVKYYNSNELKFAEYFYQISTWLKPDYGKAFYNLGSLYEDRDEIEAAIIEYDRAIKYQVAAAYNNRSRLYLLDGNCQAAAELLLKGLEIATKEPVKYALLTNLGRAKLCARAYQEAPAYLQVAIALDRDRPEAYCFLEPVLEHLGVETSQGLTECPVDFSNLPELEKLLTPNQSQQ